MLSSVSRKKRVECLLLDIMRALLEIRAYETDVRASLGTSRIWNLIGILPLAPTMRARNDHDVLQGAEIAGQFRSSPLERFRDCVPLGLEVRVALVWGTGWCLITFIAVLARGHRLVGFGQLADL